jgi:hypothetical protein
MHPFGSIERVCGSSTVEWNKGDATLCVHNFPAMIKVSVPFIHFIQSSITLRFLHLELETALPFIPLRE